MKGRAGKHYMEEQNSGRMFVVVLVVVAALAPVVTSSSIHEAFFFYSCGELHPTFHWQYHDRTPLLDFLVVATAAMLGSLLRRTHFSDGASLSPNSTDFTIPILSL